MPTRFDLGKILAVPVRATRSLFLLIALVGSSTAWLFRSSFHGHSLLAYFLAGMFSTVLFIWTVMAHEAAHVAAARRYGARVDGVTLSAIGGITAIGGEPATPWQAVVVAGSGPVASMVCGVAGIGSMFAIGRLGGPALIAISVGWVGMLCILLAVCNLLPAAPLDGGHVLQALLWLITGDRVRATLWSARVGQAVGAAGGVGGVVALVSGSSIMSALTFAGLGWIIFSGASAVRRASTYRRDLAGVSIADVMRTDAASIATAVSLRAKLTAATVDEPLADALERTHARPKRILVTRDDAVIGMVEPADITDAAQRGRERSGSVVTHEALDLWPGVSAGQRGELAA